jgi:hypothetical protein
MHGYMMPSVTPKSNHKIIFTWLHYAAITGAKMPARPGIPRLKSISHQRFGEELPASYFCSRCQSAISGISLEIPSEHVKSGAIAGFLAGQCPPTG